ncbi:MAG: heparan-alpha-glucosaminide N-acetyltransferase domain-containing protein [Comamonadaceae bacterium]
MISNRLLSLDAFRGFTIAAMLLVNNPGDWGHLYSQLAHAKWNGWTFTDWIFPFFLFISGVSLTLSLRRQSQAGAVPAALLLKLSKRAAVVFLIGLALNLYPIFDFSTVRIPGVLQRIALCTLLAGPIVLWFNWRQQCGWIAILFALYSVLMLRLPVPDAAGIIGVGVLEPGRDVGAFVDRWLLNGHLWAASRTWDPEGLVSTLPALGNLLLGVLAGRWIEQRLEKTKIAVWLLIAGLACLWLGAVLDVTLMPINKSLWTVSYAIFMNGWALIVFGVFYWLLDASSSFRLQQGSAWLLRPCVIYGMNSLFIFALSGVIAKTLLLIKITQTDGSLLSLKAMLYAAIQSLPLAAVDASLLYAMLFNGFMLCIAWLMWRQRWFVKV